jgi:protocatechuate 3,4-dioxygenase beta subunit
VIENDVNDPSEVFSHETIDLQDIAETTVDQHGNFSIKVPDITQDPILNTPGNRYVLTPRDSNWVLLPNPQFIAISYPQDMALNIIATPRPGSPAATNSNPGPLVPVAGRVIDADGRPVPAAQVVIMNNRQLESLRCPQSGDACFPTLNAGGAARATGVSRDSDGSFTLLVPAGLMSDDAVWAEARDADGRSIRTSWRVGSRQPLPTSSLGDVQLDQRLDFTLVVRGDGQPIAGAEVDFWYLGTQRTDATGSVQLHQQASRGCTPRGAAITIHAAGFASETWRSSIAKGTTTQVVNLEREAVQRGRVIDAAGRALGNAVVQAHAVDQPEPPFTAMRDPFPSESAGTAKTDDTGAFTLRSLHAGRQYRLIVISAEGAVTKGERVVSAGGTPVDIVVPKR